MNKLKNYLLISIFSLISFVSGVMVHEANASVNNVAPTPNEINIGGGIEYKRIYVSGRYYVVFWNTCGLSAVKEP